MIDVPVNRRGMQRVQTAMDKDCETLAPFCVKRKNILDQTVGKWHGDNAAPASVVVNLIETALTVWMSHLLPGLPQTLITTKRRRLMPQAAEFELATNQAMNEMKLHPRLEDALLDGLLSIGIMRVGMKGTQAHPEGEVYADTIDLSDWVHDTSAYRWEEIGYAAHRYQIDWEDIQESPLFSDEAKARVRKFDPSSDSDETQPHSLEAGETGHSEPYRERIQLWDVWFPRTRQIATLQLDGNSDKPLRVYEWDGPEGGPFHFLKFRRLPQTLMPLSPISLLFDLHQLVNSLWRKMDDQGRRQKKIGVYTPGGGTDAERIKKAQDGHMYSVGDSNAVKEIALGGVDPSNLLLAMRATDTFHMQGGNLLALGGLGPQTETVGQEELIHGAANKRIGAMARSVRDFVKGIVEHVAWYVWTDDQRVRMLNRVEPNTRFEVPVVWQPHVREGRFLNYEFDIAPYSLQDQSPAAKLGIVMKLWNGVFLPILPLLQQNGIRVNFERFVEQITKLSGSEDTLGHILERTDEMVQEMAGQRPQQSPNTTRTNVRVNRPGSTVQGRSEAMQQSLMGAAQPDMAKSMFREAG